MTPTQGFFNFFQCLISRNVISTLSKRNQLEKYKHRQIHGLIGLEVKVLQAIYIYISLYDIVYIKTAISTEMKGQYSVQKIINLNHNI